MNLCIFCHKLLLGLNPIMASSRGIKSAPTRGHEADLGAPFPTGLLRTGQRPQSEQGGRSCRSWAGTATANVSRVCGVFRVPQRPSPGSRGQGGSARSVPLSRPLPAGPSSAGTEGLPPWWGHEEKSQRRLCFQETAARRRPRCCCCSSPGSRAGGRVRTALPSQH